MSQTIMVWSIICLFVWLNGGFQNKMLDLCLSWISYYEYEFAVNRLRLSLSHIWCVFGLWRHSCCFIVIRLLLISPSRQPVDLSILMSHHNSFVSKFHWFGLLSSCSKCLHSLILSWNLLSVRYNLVCVELCV